MRKIHDQTAHPYFEWTELRLLVSGNRTIYGKQGLDCIPDLLTQVMGESGANLELLFFQSNSEGALIDRLEKAREEQVLGKCRRIYPYFFGACGLFGLDRYSLRGSTSFKYFSSNR